MVKFGAINSSTPTEHQDREEGDQKFHLIFRHMRHCQDSPLVNVFQRFSLHAHGEFFFATCSHIFPCFVLIFTFSFHLCLAITPPFPSQQIHLRYRFASKNALANPGLQMLLFSPFLSHIFQPFPIDLLRTGIESNGRYGILNIPHMAVFLVWLSPYSE